MGLLVIFFFVLMVGYDLDAKDGKTFFATLLAILIFITSCYYSIRTNEKQNMYNAFLQARINGDLAHSFHNSENGHKESKYNKIAIGWFRNGNKWGMYYTKDCYCFFILLISSMFMFLVFISSFYCSFYNYPRFLILSLFYYPLSFYYI